MLEIPSKDLLSWLTYIYFWSWIFFTKPSGFSYAYTLSIYVIYLSVYQSINHLFILYLHNQSRSCPGTKVDGEKRWSKSEYQGRKLSVHSFLFTTIGIPRAECQTVKFYTWLSWISTEILGIQNTIQATLRSGVSHT